MSQQQLTQVLGEEMQSLLLNYPPKTLNRILRNMFMDYTGRNMPISDLRILKKHCALCRRCLNCWIKRRMK